MGGVSEEGAEIEDVTVKMTLVMVKGGFVDLLVCWMGGCWD